jgi:hypothetical protein
MNRDQIEEIFIRAAETEAKLPPVKGMRADYGRYTLPWVHDRMDIGGRRAEVGDQLIDGDDPLADWRIGWLEEWARRPDPERVTQWEQCLAIVGNLVTDPGQRRALWAWASSQAGTLRHPRTHDRLTFARWCRDVEHVAEITGHRRKNRAIDRIIGNSVRGSDLHSRNSDVALLPDTPVSGHQFAIVAKPYAVYTDRPMFTWRDDPSFNRTGMTLQEWRAAKRRAREAAKRQKVAA